MAVIDVPFFNQATIRLESAILRIDGDYAHPGGATLGVGDPGNPGTDFGQLQVAGTATWAAPWWPPTPPASPPPRARPCPCSLAGGLHRHLRHRRGRLPGPYRRQDVTLAAPVGPRPTFPPEPDLPQPGDGHAEPVPDGDGDQHRPRRAHHHIGHRLGDHATDFTEPADTCSGATFAAATCRRASPSPPRPLAPAPPALTSPTTPPTPLAVRPERDRHHRPGGHLQPHQLNFADPSVATTSPARTVTGDQRRGAPLAITSATVTGANAADFAVDGRHLLGVDVAPSASCTVSLTFTPSAAGPRSPADPGRQRPRQPAQVALSGTGTTGPGVGLSPTAGGLRQPGGGHHQRGPDRDAYQHRQRP